MGLPTHIAATSGKHGPRIRDRLEPDYLRRHGCVRTAGVPASSNVRHLPHAAHADTGLWNGIDPEQEFRDHTAMVETQKMFGHLSRHMFEHHT